MPFGLQPTHCSRRNPPRLFTRSGARFRRLNDNFTTSSGHVDALGMRVHVEPPVAYEPDHGLTQLLGGRDRQARRRRNRAEHRDARNGSLLHELERQAPRDEKDVAYKWQLALEQRVTDELVERVVTTDVLTGDAQNSVSSEARRGVQAARL